MKALLIYAHFHPEGRVDGHVFHTMKHFLTEGFDALFVSTSPVSVQDAQRLQGLGVRVMTVENIGYDFYAWRSAIVDPKTDLRGYQRLVLLNSSVNGPYFDLREFLEHLESRDADVVGATLSLEIKPHLQSYFFYFKDTALNSEGFWSYWQNLVPHADRQATIDNHELRITDHLQEAGLRIDAYYKSALKTNPSLAQVGQLYAARLPFLKYSKMHPRKMFALKLKLTLRACWLTRRSHDRDALFLKK